MQVHNTVARHGQYAAHVAKMPLRGFDVLPLGKKDADAVQVFVLVADLYRLAEQTEVGRADRFLSRWLQKNRPRSVRDRIGGFFGAER